MTTEASSARSQTGTRFSSILFGPMPDEGIPDEDGTVARDLNLDQIVAAVAADREESELIAAVLSGHLRDPDAVRYRQEIFTDLEDPDLFKQVGHFSSQIQRVGAHFRQLDGMHERYQREGWFLDAAAIYCDAVQSLAGYLASAPLGSRGLRAFRDYVGRYLASDGFAVLARDTGDRQRALGQIRYRTRIHGNRVDVSHYAGEADYSAAVLATFERFKQGATRDYRARYRTWPGMNHVAAQILERVALLFPDEFAALDEYCRRHSAFLDEGIRLAHRELQFYLAYLGYIGPLRSAGLDFCYPVVSATSKEIEVTGTFDLALASKLVAEHKPVVTNDFGLTGRERIYVTFVDELASLGEQIVSMMSTVDPANPAERTYKVVRKPADGLAYALALAEKYDITYERLLARVAS